MDEYKFTCPACGYAMKALLNCENPTCLDNPSHTHSWRLVLAERQEIERKKRTEYEKTLGEKTKLKRRGFITPF